MLDAFRCYSLAAGLLLSNIKSYACMVVMNILFFIAVLFLPFVIYFLPVSLSADDFLLVISLIVCAVFTIVNFPMLVLAQNIVDLGERDEAFAVKDLFKTNIFWKQIFGIGIGVNFVVLSFIIAVFVFAKLTTSTEILVTFSTFMLFVELFITVYNYLFINKANALGKLPGFGNILTLIGKNAKLIYSFCAVYILTSLVNCYLIYMFFSGMDALITFILKDQAYSDLQLSFLHAGFSLVLLVLFNTVSLTAKAQLFRTIQGIQSRT